MQSISKRVKSGRSLAEFRLNNPELISAYDPDNVVNFICHPEVRCHCVALRCCICFFCCAVSDLSFA